ncbi:MAG: zinc ribbon domain-containing protein [Deltaproteobacteria bacterium]|nr:zinc ribbon domain-containing protein [Deltaproteobacteria bacterium]
MFFFIAGIQPKTVDLDDQPMMCPSCGLFGARLRRVDHYLSLFFVPLFPVKRGVPFLACNRCGNIPREPGREWSAGSVSKKDECPSCGGKLDSSFNYCPSCGKRIR